MSPRDSIRQQIRIALADQWVIDKLDVLLPVPSHEISQFVRLVRPQLTIESDRWWKHFQESHSYWAELIVNGEIGA